jgi:hypothetical protein
VIDMSTDPASDAAASMTAASDEAVQRIRELTEQFIESAKAAGNQSLDAYEQSLRTLVDFQKQAAGASHLDWVSSVATAQAKFLQDVTDAYVSAARTMLK